MAVRSTTQVKYRHRTWDARYDEALIIITTANEIEFQTMEQYIIIELANSNWTVGVITTRYIYTYCLFYSIYYDTRFFPCLVIFTTYDYIIIAIIITTAVARISVIMSINNDRPFIHLFVSLSNKDTDKEMPGLFACTNARIS